MGVAVKSSDRMDVMHHLQNMNTTHLCPVCGQGTYCDMEKGKSGSACWCMSVDGVTLENRYEQCVCKSCLEGE